MSGIAGQKKYEGRILIDNKVISTINGNSIDELQVILTSRCELEKSGAVGEIIELCTGTIVYQCRKQSE
ncbi:hypothetical protein [Legionella rowbothamii]|uniref:hypothetical protein n=1 Tax=Legionella rowbothamii TaxID=96229 RepID=UPI001055582A|nr:hypothetical protein [Legionella rowbothamii]